MKFQEANGVSLYQPGDINCLSRSGKQPGSDSAELVAADIQLGWHYICGSCLLCIWGASFGVMAFSCLQTGRDGSMLPSQRSIPPFQNFIVLGLAGEELG